MKRLHFYISEKITQQIYFSKGGVVDEAAVIEKNPFRRLRLDFGIL